MRHLITGLALLLLAVEASCGVTVKEIPGNPNCNDVCSGCYTQLKIAPPREGISTDGILVVNIFNVVKSGGNWLRFDWTSNIPVNVVLVKGGRGANGYFYDPPATSGSGLSAPGQKGISHIIFCYVPSQLEVHVSGLSDLTVDQAFISQGYQYGSLGMLSVAITAPMSYTASIYYTYTVVHGSSAPFTGNPLSLQAASGIWYTIPKYPSSTTLPDFSGNPGTETHTYPVRVDLALLGDRAAGDVIEFTIHVTVSSSSP